MGTQSKCLEGHQLKRGPEQLLAHVDPSSEPGYRLASRGRQKHEDDRLGLLERIFDPLSRRRREMVRPGWRCLEVGAGRGSMAVWLAEQVGENGLVVATDIDVTYLQRLHLPNLVVREHNILADPLDALGTGSFDMVSSRLMLFWLVDEDGDWGTVTPVDQSHPFCARYQGAYRNGEWWAARGYDPIFGRKLPLLFERCGLENIRHEATAEVVRGGSPWARWWQQTLEAIREWERAERGLTKAREEEYKALLTPWIDPSFWFQNALVHACWGQHPRRRPTP